MWLEVTDKVIDLPGIFILKDNPITVGAWSVLPTLKRFALWVHTKRYTAKLLDNAFAEKCTFSITNDFNSIRFCGHVSGRAINKLEHIQTVSTDGYRYIGNSEYVLLLTIENILPINGFLLVLCNIDNILNFKGGEHWVQLP